MNGLHSQPAPGTNTPNQPSVLGPYYNVGLGPELNSHSGNNIYQLTNGGGLELVGTVPQNGKIHSKSSSSSSSGSVLSNLSTTDYLIIGGGILLVIFLF